MIGFNCCFDFNFGVVKIVLDVGEVGKVELLLIILFDLVLLFVLYIEVFGGLFCDMMIYDFDMVNFLMGVVLKIVFVIGLLIVDLEIGKVGDVDIVVVMLIYEDGCIVVIKNLCCVVYGYDQCVELLGFEGLLQVQNMFENMVVKLIIVGVIGVKLIYFFFECYMLVYVVEWGVFVDVIVGKLELLVIFEDGVFVFVMVEVVIFLFSEGCLVVLDEVY